MELVDQMKGKIAYFVDYLCFVYISNRFCLFCCLFGKIAYFVDYLVGFAYFVYFVDNK